jgi:hypothetical protein
VLHDATLVFAKETPSLERHRVSSFRDLLRIMNANRVRTVFEQFGKTLANLALARKHPDRAAVLFGGRRARLAVGSFEGNRNTWLRMGCVETVARSRSKASGTSFNGADRRIYSSGRHRDSRFRTLRSNEHRDSLLDVSSKRP